MVALLLVAALQEVAAPEIAGGTEWVNVKDPLTMAGLRGKVVLLHFWTYG